MKLSVIVPVYNVEQYLQKCVDSILNQSFSDLEILLVNDGSTDGSPAICDWYATHDSRIIVIHQQNGGVSSARNAGIQFSTGDYLTFVDSDDWLDKDMYLQMQKAVNTHPGVDVVMCDFLNVQNDKEVKVSSPLRAGMYSKKEIIQDIYPVLIVTEDFGRLPIISACTCIFNKAFFVDKGIRFDVSLRYSEDYLFMAEVISQCKAYYYIKDCFSYHYRQYEESRSKKYQPEWWATLKSLNKKLRNTLFVCEDYDFTRQLKLQLIHSALFVINSIVKHDITTARKLVMLKEIFNDENLKTAFSNLTLDKQNLPLRIVLYLMKKRSAGSYLLYRNMVSKIKN